MNSNAMLQAAITAGKSAASQTGVDLPAQNRSLQSADFERLMAQAQEQQVNVQLANPVGELGQKGVQRTVGNVSDASRNLTNSIEASRQAVAKVDPKDPASVFAAVDQVNQTMAAAGQLTLVMHEVTAVRKGLGELFHNQG
jgi:hypothetical protein